MKPRPCRCAFDFRFQGSQKFAENFDPVSTGIRFPTVIAYSPEIIVETFEPGVYINKLVDDAKHEDVKVRFLCAREGSRFISRKQFEDASPSSARALCSR